AFVTPWFVKMSIREPTVLTAMIATVVLNLVGLVTGALQPLLRANTATTSFRPKATPDWSGKKHEIRIWSPNDLGFGGHILQPLFGPRSPVPSSSVASFYREKYRAPISESTQSPVRIDNKAKNTQLPLSNPSPVTPTGLPSRPNQAITAGSPPSRLYKHKPSQSYSLFPNEEPSTSPSRQQEPSSTISTTKLPSTTFMLPSQMDLNPAAELQRPPALVAPRGYRRDSTMVSSAIVQIGIRLTYMEEERCPLLTEAQKAEHTQSTNSKLGPRLKSPALQIQTETLPSLQSQLGYERLSPQERAATMKTLPPVPRPNDERMVLRATSHGYHLRYTRRRIGQIQAARKGNPMVSKMKSRERVRQTGLFIAPQALWPSR
ncbi:hypothetical protein V500_02995, partial [Pseudogymnoascus sp. VKM F-4518 (FW-2643)]